MQNVTIALTSLVGPIGRKILTMNSDRRSGGEPTKRQSCRSLQADKTVGGTLEEESELRNTRGIETGQRAITQR